ncbi:MAG: TMEM175 family protein, partial [Halobacteriota archaeon]
MGNITTEKETTDSPETLSDYDRRAVDRLIFFSDAVFAIAITLLTLSITVPVIRQDAVETEL